jgi:hypothetical protein
MKKYHVHVCEVHVSTREIWASSSDAAIERVSRGEGDEVMCEYSHTMSQDTWDTEEIEPPVLDQVAHEAAEPPAE